MCESFLESISAIERKHTLRRSTSKEPCGLCRCTLHGSTSFWDFRKDAPWTRTLWTPRTWRAWDRRTRCVLLNSRLLGGLFVHYDVMHSKWLGWAQYLYGSIFWMLCYEQMLQSPLENLVRLGGFIRGWQSRNPCNNKYSQSLNKVNMFVKQKDYPKLRGKACELQDLSPCILAMWERFADCTSEEGRKVLLLLQLNEQQDTFLKRSDRNRYALSEEEGNTLMSATRRLEFCFRVRF